MTTLLFQACYGPSMNKIHIVKCGEILVLCQATSYAANITGKIFHNAICERCIFRMAERMKEHRKSGGVITKCDTPDNFAQTIGVEKIL
jgi:hypothetical protein